MGNFRFSSSCFQNNFTSIDVSPTPPDIEDMFEKYSKGGTHMTGDQLRRFITEVQGGGGDESAEEIIDQVLQGWHHIANKFSRKTSLNFEDFQLYLLSPDLNPPISSQGIQDMTLPLSHYYIYTGHNSYLTGNQLSSNSSDVPIIKALKRGVRAIELDLWPNSSKKDVLVLHGWTLTSPVKLIKCLKAIKEFAFCASPYPVILTLEDHLTTDLQAKVAQMITQTFGHMLYCSESECLRELPSPEELKYRIIISTKLPKDKSINGRRHKKTDSYEELLKKESSDLSEEDRSNGSESCESFQAPAYKRIIAIQSGNLTDRLKNELKFEPEKVRRVSMNEDKFKKACELYGTDVIRFTQKSILRIYPKQTRFNSSNYNPITGWIHGAQMVAFNMQGYGKYLWMMHGMFRANSECGYVKKPDFLINDNLDGEVYNLLDNLQVKKTLKLKVYMGDGWHSDFYRSPFRFWSPPQFYARVGVAGIPADKTMKKTKKQVGSWKPIWDEEFEFPLRVPELALLRIEVHKYNMSDKDDFSGQTCLPVFQLRPGIRAVPLYDRKGEKLGSVRLLMKFEFV